MKHLTHTRYDQRQNSLSDSIDVKGFIHLKCIREHLKARGL